MKVLKLFLVVAVASLFVIGCSGGGANAYDDCLKKATEAAKKQGVPEEAAKKAAELGCEQCKSDPKGDLCQGILKNL